VLDLTQLYKTKNRSRKHNKGVDNYYYQTYGFIVKHHVSSSLNEIRAISMQQSGTAVYYHVIMIS